MNTPEEIKRVSLNYVVDLLSKKPTDGKYAEEINLKKTKHFERMEEVVEDDLDELPLTTFQKTLELLNKKPGNKYDFITKAGQSLKMALYTLFKQVWEKETIPKKWLESTVI